MMQKPPMVQEAPMGYSFVGLWNDEQKALNWYAAAMKAKDTKPYVMTHDGELYTLWVKKRKNEKMVGKGW
jgi:hypothetical protein